MLSFFQPRIYIQISPHLLTLKNLKSGLEISEVAELAVSLPPKPKAILGVGAEARVAAASEPAQLIQPFAHPRSLVSDFASAEALIRVQLQRALGKGWLRAAPSVVIHPLGDPDGGFTQVELRAFREMALGAGASTVRVWTGRPLANHELLSDQVALSGGKWE
ncbi:MAG: rod shape-determining protein [Aquabacterium sp.]|jgi:rod shape-determining protein MreB|uniref:rod shape-determining protein MreB n=1 Tax=Aquabacterium sp. TaxID=1872578 RepID=UPI002A35C221|nr:rod shape-determining protein MreB [Aquabacterium sp.]MDX9843665.1 rod shape-determining protein [Aquabacterium sp.]